MNGENFVSLKGKLKFKNLRQLGTNNTNVLKAKLVIPIDNKAQYIKVSAWNSLAEDLYNLDNNAFIHVHGHIEESAYTSNCIHCNGPDKKYWTEVVIDNFKIILEED